MYFLVVLAIFKNESHALREWIQHYVREGVEKFYLIDNNSQDKPEEILAEFGDKINLRKSDTRHAQIDLYNAFRPQIGDDGAEWVAVVDLDEFLYARARGQTLVSYLQTLDVHVGQILTPWRCFGSSGRIEQPDSIISGFRHYQKEDHTPMQAKSIARVRYVSEYNIHFHRLLGGRTITSDNTDVPVDPFVTRTEKLEKEGVLRLNHYRIQSFAFFMAVKATRGAADTVLHETIRTEDYFKQNDINDEYSSELADKWK